MLQLKELINMKQLELQKNYDLTTKYFIYRVLDESGNTIACRVSNTDYIACYIIPNRGSPVQRKVLPYKICNCFSRKDLIGKGSSARIIPYAIAYLKQPDNFL